MRNRRRTRLLRRLVLGLAVAAILVPTAQARPDEGTGVRAPAEQFVPGVTDFPSSVVDRPVQGVNYNEFAYTRALPQDYGVRTVQVAQRDGFDWGDAGMGAGSALVLLLLAGGATLATRHIGRPATA